ncbi:MAG: peptidylprolyl isomerase, partial [Brevundimonas sp.]|nr:peptidylprolyl isomerase [Brevundimonas sp.]
MRPKAILAATLLVLASCASLPADPARPRVALDTTEGRILLALDAVAAPISTCNFINYVVFGDYDNGSFF